MMYIQLRYRHYGVHEPIKHIEIPCDFREVYKGDDRIDEKLLLKNIPVGWLPTAPEKILLTVGNEHGSTGQCTNGIFHTWAKYFDAYVLELLEKPEQWWEEE